MTHLAIVFPGMGYVHHHAVLNATHVALQQLGATTVPITYDDVHDAAVFGAGVRRDTRSPRVRRPPWRSPSSGDA